MSLSFAVCSLLRQSVKGMGGAAFTYLTLSPGMGVVCHKEGVTCFNSHEGVLWTGANLQKTVPSLYIRAQVTGQPAGRYNTH